jgi:hypothetical protein
LMVIIRFQNGVRFVPCGQQHIYLALPRTSTELLRGGAGIPRMFFRGAAVHLPVCVMLSSAAYLFTLHRNATQAVHHWRSTVLFAYS